ncbi:unnamed protein product [Anisakis simplex]|uniref:Uncharacterized protein n=1 Tax=Anisakis simplex TaxID=6269 RepID=A0A0M3JNA1_ANISI|nr:unnamed protein product [Anisakis simplex]
MISVDGSTTVHMTNGNGMGSAPGGCLKCTQQVFGYQQLLTLIDPNVVIEPTLFSTVLAACPHINNFSSLS